MAGQLPHPSAIAKTPTYSVIYMTYLFPLFVALFDHNRPTQTLQTDGRH